jgi:hypothetical protein
MENFSNHTHKIPSTEFGFFLMSNQGVLVHVQVCNTMHTSGLAICTVLVSTTISPSPVVTGNTKHNRTARLHSTDL